MGTSPNVFRPECLTAIPISILEKSLNFRSKNLDLVVKVNFVLSSISCILVNFPVKLFLHSLPKKEIQNKDSMKNAPSITDMEFSERARVALGVTPLFGRQVSEVAGAGPRVVHCVHRFIFNSRDTLLANTV